MSDDSYPRTRACIRQTITAHSEVSDPDEMSELIAAALHRTPRVASEFASREVPKLRGIIVAMFKRRGQRGKNIDWLHQFTGEQQQILTDLLGQERFPP